MSLRWTDKAQRILEENGFDAYQLVEFIESSRGRKKGFYRRVLAYDDDRWEMISIGFKMGAEHKDMVAFEYEDYYFFWIGTEMELVNFLERTFGEEEF